MKLFQLLLVVIFSGFLFACGGGGGNSSGLSTPPAQQPEQPQPIVIYAEPVAEAVIFNQFSFENNNKLAATNSGIYKLDNSQWTLISDANWYVYDIAVLSDSHFIASIGLNNKYYLVESVNSGALWDILTTDFGGPDRDLFNGNEKVNRIQYDESTGILYATGYDVLATSNDFGRNWIAVSGLWQGLAKGLVALAINFDQDTVWFGGQGAIENPVFKEYSMTNGALTVHDDISRLLPVPSTINAIVFHPTETQSIFAMGEGGIVVSRNNGNNWDGFLLYDNYRFYYNLVINPNENDQMYTAGWSKDINTPQKLIIERTLDGGVTWEEHKHPSDTLFGGVRSIAHSLNQNGEFVLHFGLQQGGVIDVRFTD